MKTSKFRARLLGGLAMATTAALGLVATPATAGPITPYYGQISPFYGQISPFYGQISPFYGKISPFYGQISPFYGDISAFYGQISPFTTTTNAQIAALYSASGNDPWWGSNNPYTNSSKKTVSYSTVNPFWRTEYSSWMTAWTAWQNAKTASDYQNVANLLQNTVLNPANNFWGSSISKGGSNSFAKIATSTLGAAGVTFTNGVIDASSLANASQSQEAMFFLNFYDQLMAYSGTGHVDWWMGSAHWSPALAEIATSSVSKHAPVTIGMLDFTADPTGKSTGKGSIQQYGSNVYSNGHGAAVESLIAGSRDGTGIMGVLPSGVSNIVAYNPYDSTDTTNWTDIGTGLATLSTSFLRLNGNLLNPAAVINASLGVPGYTLHPDWNTVFTGNLLLSLGAAHNTILVVAAGNDGSSQTVNVPWNFNINPTLLVVGSVGVDGTISNFSNRPGTACLSQTNLFGATTGCTQSLASRFIVAPGELMLITDNQGNISRQTGTSLAAPLVTGAIGLLYARWPWLTGYSTETANIILQSATKLGTHPGADEVYGAGELNIQASQSPLSWSALTYYPVTNGMRSILPVSAASVVNTVKTGNQTAWNNQSLYFVALETVGRTYRDFQIPMSTKLVGQSVASDGGNALFQSYLNTSLQAWVAGGAKFSDAASPVRSGMANFMESSTAGGKVGGMQLRMTMTASTPTYGFRTDNAPYKTDVALIGTQSALRFGNGDGAVALNTNNGFSERSDHDTQRGGANPLLGLASGGLFADYRASVAPGLALNIGVTQRRDTRDTQAFGIASPGAALGAAVYEASAMQVGADMAVGRGLMLHSAITRLHENSGLLGLQSTDVSELGKGSDTTGVTLGFDLTLPADMMLSATGTLARTNTLSGQALQAGSGGLQSSAGEVALTKARLFAATDRVRFTVSKAMNVDGGRLHYATYGVVDRDTGELGVIQENVNAASGRVPVSAELMYGRLFPKSRTEMSFFLRAEHDGYDAPANTSMAYTAGGKVKFTF
jgi:hypothetical protein